MFDATKPYRRGRLRFPDDPPNHFRCPNCRHNYEVVAYGPPRWISKRRFGFFRHFLCRVCGYRFRKLNARLTVSVGAGLLALAAAILLACVEHAEPGWIRSMVSTRF